ncbi:MAG: hypothetical protein JOZ56_01210 [Actinobacteria bacterium]|nr:hypothetical protein [Actinomycetota bacterium]
MDRGHALDVGRRRHADARENRLGGWLRRRSRRRAADALLRASGGHWERHPSVAWRVAELTSPRERRRLAGMLDAIARELRDPRPALSASVLARRRLRPHVAALELLSDRLSDLDRPATGAAIVHVHDLLTDGAGPLYIAGDAAALVPAIDRIHDLLEVH